MTGPQSVHRALALLRCFTREDTFWSMKDLASETGLPKATTHRLLQALVEGGFLAVDSTSHLYAVGQEVLRFARGVFTQPDTRTLLSLASPVMTRLREQTGETVGLYRRIGWHRMLISEFEGPQPMRIVLGTGRIRPIFQGTVGRAFLSGATAEEMTSFVSSAGKEQAAVEKDSATVRRLGYVMTRGTSVPGAATIAAPITRGDAAVEGALCITGPVSRWTDESSVAYCTMLAREARVLSKSWADGRTHQGPRDFGHGGLGIGGDYVYEPDHDAGRPLAP